MKRNMKICLYNRHPAVGISKFTESTVLHLLKIVAWVFCHVTCVFFNNCNIKYFSALAEGGLSLPNLTESLSSTLRDANEMVRNCSIKKQG